MGNAKNLLTNFSEQRNWPEGECACGAVDLQACLCSGADGLKFTISLPLTPSAADYRRR